MNPVSGGDAVRAAIAMSVDELSHSADPQRIVAKTLELIGTATGANRIRIYGNGSLPGAPSDPAKRYEWHSADIAASADTNASADAAARLANLLPRLAAGDVRALLTRELKGPLRDLLRADGVKSLLLLPVLADGEPWGKIEVDDCRTERSWSALDIETFTTLAAIVGAALARASDAGELADAARIIARLSRTDQLTALANRNGFIDVLQRAFTAAKRGAKPFAILYIDLDRFKDINDVLGHSKGDELLTLVAERLKEAVRDNDLIARFGGDEFSILQTNLSDPSDAGALAMRILRNLADPPYDIGTQVDITASVGISFFAQDIQEPEDMLKQADVALYRAKDSGRNQFHFHSEALDIAIIERVTLAGDLRRAVARHEIELYYQPQVEVCTGRIVGVEALARWHHPTQGMLCPGRFIPVAEHTDTIVPLGRWIIDDACRQITEWRAEKLQPDRVAINVSAVQIKAAPDFDRELMECLKRWDIPPSAVEIELTESVLMETTQEHRGIIARLRALGVSIAIDDFGTGYSSLSYLRAYSVSHIKIAQDFIQNLEPNSGDIAIVRAAIGLSQALGIEVIAEGVETEFQLGLLTDAGCQYIQGYYYSRPVSAAKMTELLRKGILQPANSPLLSGGQ